MHPLLVRQLKKLSLTSDALPDCPESWQSFVTSVDRAYEQADDDRYLLERSLAMSSQEMEERHEELERLSERLSQSNAALSRLACEDGLTNLLNRRAWSEASLREQERSYRYNRAYSILMLDIDHFKAFNDSLGHQAGDGCLRNVASAIASMCRAIDSVGRYGGEEFVILAAETPAGDAAALAERIREAVWDLAIPHPGSPAGRVTVSIGVACSSRDPLEAVLQRADAALYAAKGCGRNLVFCADGKLPMPAPRLGSNDGRLSTCGESGAAVNSLILVAVSDPSERSAYIECLDKPEYRIVELDHDLDPLSAVISHSPDIIIMDADETGAPGLERVRQIRSHPESREVRIILVSSDVSEAEMQSNLLAGVDECLIKPVRGSELLFRVRSMIRYNRERHDLLRSYRLRAEQIRVLHVLVELCRVVGNSKSLDDVSDHAAEAVAQIIMAKHIAVLWPDNDRTFLTVARYKSKDPKVAPETTIPIATTAYGRVFATRRGIIINDNTDAEKYGHAPNDSPMSALPLLVAPIINGNEDLGILLASERVGGGNFETRDLEYVELVLNIVASVIAGVRNRSARDTARDLIVTALAKLAEHRDCETARHVDRVTEYAIILARHLQENPRFRHKIDGEFLHDLRRAVPLHDIGKVAIPDSILRKPSKLTVQEMAIMKTHAEIGAETLRPVIAQVPDVKYLQMADVVIRSHHEWYDGTGYPQGLSGDDIPLAARIVAVADVYDALTSDRVYRPAMTSDEAESTIINLSGRQFDPAIVSAFQNSLQEFRALATQLGDQPE